MLYPKSTRDKLTAAKHVYVQVTATEFWIRVPKSEIAALAKHLGGWGRITVELLNFDEAYVSVEDA